MTLKIIVADDHPMVVQGLKSVIIQLQSDVQVLEACSYPSLLETIAGNRDLDLVVTDLGMPGRAGWQGLANVLAQVDGTPVLIFSGNDEPRTVRRAANAGVSGYMTKSQDAAQMICALRSVLDGEKYFPAHLMAVASQDQDADDISMDADLQVRDLMDRIPNAVFLVNQHGQVINSNSLAMALLGEGDGLLIDAGGVLRAQDRGQGREILRLIECAALDEARQDEALALNRKSGLRPYAVVVSSLSAGAGKGAWVFITDPEKEVEIPQATIMRLYGLTEGEARVVKSLVSGRTPDGVARQLDISVNTVRTHLKSAFGKIGASGQPELIKRVLTDIALVSTSRQ